MLVASILYDPIMLCKFDDEHLAYKISLDDFNIAPKIRDFENCDKISFLYTDGRLELVANCYTQVTLPIQYDLGSSIVDGRDFQDKSCSWCRVILGGVVYGIIGEPIQLFCRHCQKFRSTINTVYVDLGTSQLENLISVGFDHAMTIQLLKSKITPICNGYIAEYDSKKILLTTWRNSVLEQDYIALVRTMPYINHMSIWNEFE